MKPRLAGARWAVALAALAVFACGVRWYYVVTAPVVEPIRGDAREYYAYAWNLVHHGIFSKASGSAQALPDSYRDPGYPVYLAGWMALTHEDSVGSLWYAAVLIGQAILGGFTAVLAAAFSRRWLAGKAALLVGVLVAVWPHCIAIDGDLTSETLFGFLTLLAAWLTVVALERRSQWRVALAGTAFSLAALTNAILLPFAPLLALWLAWKRRVPAKMAAVFFLSALALPALWWVRGSFLPENGASSHGRAMMNFVQGSWPEYFKAWRKVIVFRDETARPLLDTVNREIDQAIASPAQGLKAVLSRMAADPLRYAWWYLGKPAMLWGWDEQIGMGQGDFYVFLVAASPYVTSVLWRASASICRALNGWLLLAAAVAAGAWLMGKPFAIPPPQGTQALDIAALLALYVTLVYGVFQSEPRYSIPFRPFEFALAVSTLAGIAARWRASRDAAGSARSP